MPTTVPGPTWSDPIVDQAGFPTRWFRFFIQAVFSALRTDLTATMAAVDAAAPASALVVATGGLKQGGPIGPNAAVALYSALTTVAMLPTSGMAEGDWAYALNGRKAGEGAGSGTGTPVFYSRGSWVAVDSGATVAA
ncbi:MAG TPA: hypothetical protein VII73_10655 [Caulobacteraceae bacterium]